MRWPGPATPAPVGQHELERSVGCRAGGWRRLDRTQRLGGRLGGDRRRQHRVAGGRLGPSAPDLGEDEGPRGIVARPDVVEAAQARCLSRHDERAHYADGLAGRDCEMRDAIPGELRAAIRGPSADKYDQVRPEREAGTPWVRRRAVAGGWPAGMAGELAGCQLA